MFRFQVVLLSVAVALAVGGCNSHLGNRDDHDDHDDHDGTVEETIQLEQVPANVRQAFEREFPGARIKQVEKETYDDGLVHYEFEFVAADGKETEVEFDADGERLPEH